jgi:hypothetical protein
VVSSNRSAANQASATFESRFYAVRLGPVETCECPDYEQRGAKCLHVTAAAIARAKSTTCSCCGQRVPWKFVTEVTEDDCLLSWFPGDRLCADCVHGGTGHEEQGKMCWWRFLEVSETAYLSLNLISDVARCFSLLLRATVKHTVNPVPLQYFQSWVAPIDYRSVSPTHLDENKATSS